MLYISATDSSDIEEKGGGGKEQEKKKRSSIKLAATLWDVLGIYGGDIRDGCVLCGGGYATSG